MTNRLNSYRPVKQRRALLESNSPRDNWIERRRNKTVSTFGEAIRSPKAGPETFISEPEHAFLKLIQTCLEELKEFSGSTTSTKQSTKNHLSWYPFFRSKPTHLHLKHENPPRPRFRARLQIQWGEPFPRKTGHRILGLRERNYEPRQAGTP